MARSCLPPTTINSALRQTAAYLLALSLLAAVSSATPALSGQKQFVVAKVPTPLLNRPDFTSIFGSSPGTVLQKDSCGQLRALEFIALPGTLFTIGEEFEKDGRHIYRVTTTDYPYPSKSGYFIDAAFVDTVAGMPTERPRSLPPASGIIAAMKRLEGARYVWGGNVSQGLPQLLQLYPSAGGENTPSTDMEIRSLHGVDCSGLLYEATNGYTPRNTSSLVSYGRAVTIAGKSPAGISAVLKPLDLIVWPGHVMIVIDEGKVIESRLVCSHPEHGVRIRTIPESLAEIMKKRRPADRITDGSKEFVVRRWYQE